TGPVWTRVLPLFRRRCPNRSAYVALSRSRRTEKHQGPSPPSQGASFRTMKRIGLAIAAAVLGTTGVASAAMSVHQFNLSGSSTGFQSVAFDASADNLAANCWATPGGIAASCSTTAGLPGVSLPGLSSLDQVTGLVNPQALVAEAKGVAATAVGGAAGAAGNAVEAAGGLPVDCSISAGAPSAVSGALPGAVTDAVNTVLGTVGSATGVHVTTNGSGTTSVGCGGNTSGVSSAAGTATNAATGAVNSATNAVS